MRFKNEKNDLKIYAVAGTQTVLLSFEIPKLIVDNKKLLGFTIKRTDKNNKVLELYGSKYFLSLINDPVITDPSIKFFSPIQSYMWKDYMADPDETYTYTVQAITGTPLKHTAEFESSIKITTEKMEDGMHSVYFNYGVTGSQAYLKHFDKKLISELTPQSKQDEAYAFLGRELWNDGLMKFVSQANSSKYQLYGVFYEFQHSPFLLQIKKASQSGATVEIRYSAQPDQKIKNENAIATAGITTLCGIRTKANQPHNKFMILCENINLNRCGQDQRILRLPGFLDNATQVTG